MKKSLIVGIVYSKFHEKLGSKPVLCYPPDMTEDIKNFISVKTFKILIGEKGSVSKSLAILPFPLFKLKGLVNVFKIKNEKEKVDLRDATLTLLFDEENDSIFYKYMSSFEPLFNETVEQIIELEETSANPKQILDEITKLYKEAHEMLEELREMEISAQKREAFPKTPTRKDLEFGFKIIICGDPEVGKTSVILKYTDRAFKRVYIPTIGVNLSAKEIIYEGLKIGMTFWDLGGQSKFQMIRQHFYEGADGMLLVFDLTQDRTFHHVADWYRDVKKFLKKDLCGLIIGNKSDLIDQKQISEEQIQELAQELNLQYIEASALTGKNIDEAFYQLGDLMYHHYDLKTRIKQRSVDDSTN